MASYLLMCERQHEQALQKNGVIRNCLGTDRRYSTLQCVLSEEQTECDSLLSSVLPNWTRDSDFFFLKKPNRCCYCGKTFTNRSKYQPRPCTPTSFIYHDTPGCNTFIPPRQMCSQSSERGPIQRAEQQTIVFLLMVVSPPNKIWWGWQLEDKSCCCSISLFLLACGKGKAVICSTMWETSSREPVPTLAAREGVW